MLPFRTAKSATTASTWPHHKLGPLVPILVGSLLVAEGAIKTYSSVTGSTFESTLLSSRWALMAIAQVELWLGLWLLAGPSPGVARSMAVVLLVVFCEVNLDKTFEGDTSFESFGLFFAGHPAVLALDLLAVIALILWSPHPPARFPRKRVAVFAVVGVVVASGGVIVNRPLGVSPSADRALDSGTVVVRPEEWIGLKFPLLDHTDLRDELGHGSWVVVFHRHNCEACQALIPRIEEMARSAQRQGAGLRYALLEVPEPGRGEPAVLPVDTACRWGRLNGSNEWIMKTPVAIRLHDGTVAAVARDPTELPAAPTQAELPLLDGFPDYERARREHFLREIACGPLALAAILESLGRRPEPAEMERLVSAAGDRGTDLFQLKELAETCGLYAVGAYVSTAQLRRIGLPAIVHLNGAAFAAITGYSNGEVQVVYPLQAPKLVPDATLEKSFGRNGIALLLSRQNITARSLGLAEPSGETADRGELPLTLERSSLAVGRITTHHWQATLQLTNDGAAAIGIKDVIPSCTCMTARVDNALVPPGGVTTLRVEGNQAVLGGFTYRIAIVTDRPGSEPIKIPVRGYLASPILFSKPAVTLGPILVGGEAFADLPIALTEGAAIEELEVTGSKDLPITLEFTSRTGARVRCRGATQPGWHRAVLHVRTRGIKDGAAAQLHVAVHVVPAVEIFPPVLFLPDNELDGTWSRRLSIRLNQQPGGLPKVSWEDTRFSQAVRAEIKQISDRQYEVILTSADLKAIRELHNSRGKLLVRLGDAQESGGVGYLVLGAGGFETAEAPVPFGPGR